MSIEEETNSRFDNLIRFCLEGCEEGSQAEITKAFDFAKGILGENKFPTGEIILNHALDVALIVASEIGLGADSVIAGLLHNPV